jgi:hypothetical protein
MTNVVCDDIGYSDQLTTVAGVVPVEVRWLGRRPGASATVYPEPMDQAARRRAVTRTARTLSVCAVVLVLAGCTTARHAAVQPPSTGPVAASPQVVSPASATPSARELSVTPAAHEAANDKEILRLRNAVALPADAKQIASTSVAALQAQPALCQVGPDTSHEAILWSTRRPAAAVLAGIRARPPAGVSELPVSSAGAAAAPSGTPTQSLEFAAPANRLSGPAVIVTVAGTSSGAVVRVDDWLPLPPALTSPYVPLDPQSATVVATQPDQSGHVRVLRRKTLAAPAARQMDALINKLVNDPSNQTSCSPNARTLTITVHPRSGAPIVLSDVCGQMTVSGQRAILLVESTVAWATAFHRLVGP